MRKDEAKKLVTKASDDELLKLRAQWSVELGLGKNPVAKFGAPVSFTANLSSILPGVGPVPLSTSALANGFRTPYYIDEIRMQAYMTTPSATLVQPSYAMQFEFRTGAHKFSLVPVPMILHQPTFYTINAALRSEFTGGLARLGDEARWNLAKPLWMGPGDQIQCNVTRLLTPASSGNAPFAVDVTYIGRAIPPGTKPPFKRFVPWIAPFIHDFDDLFSQTTTQFRNEFQVPLNIHRLVGHPLSKATSGTFETARSNMLPDITGNQYPSIYMEDSLGYKITREFMPAGAIFDTERCVWTFARPIGPQEQLNMQIRTAGSVDAANRLFGIALHGYREE